MGLGFRVSLSRGFEVLGDSKRIYLGFSEEEQCPFLWVQGWGWAAPGFLVRLKAMFCLFCRFRVHLRTHAHRRIVNLILGFSSLYRSFFGSCLLSWLRSENEHCVWQDPLSTRERESERVRAVFIGCYSLRRCSRDWEEVYDVNYLRREYRRSPRCLHETLEYLKRLNP